jgi:phage shock protein E
MSRSLPRVATLIALTLFLTACSSGGSGGDTGSAGWTKIDAATLNERLQTEDVYLVNVHVPYEGEIPGTDAFIPYDQITAHLSELPSDTGTLVIYCRSGNMSEEAAQAMVDAGVTGFAELDGGFYAWQAAGLPFEAHGPGENA